MKVADLLIRARCADHQEQDLMLKTQEGLLRKFSLENQIKIRKTVVVRGPGHEFNQHTWPSYIKNIRRSKDKPELLLFTDWDRLTRNIASSLLWIAQLQKLGVKPMATTYHESNLDLIKYLVFQPAWKNLQDVLSNRSAQN